MRHASVFAIAVLSISAACMATNRQTVSESNSPIVPATGSPAVKTTLEVRQPRSAFGAMFFVNYAGSPRIMSVNVTQFAAKRFLISGKTLGARGVVIDGAAQGWLVVDQFGDFSDVFEVQALGPISVMTGNEVYKDPTLGYVGVTDSQTVNLSNVAPTIASFSISAISVNGTKAWTFTGTVTDDNPFCVAGVGVTFYNPSGQVVGYATTNPNGTFSTSSYFDGNPRPVTGANITAIATDWYWLTGSRTAIAP